jgi:putative flippase GtrA
MTPRAVAFVAVGAGGFAIQQAALTALTAMLHYPVPLATAIAVEAAVLVNFCCHEAWTWRDRREGEARLTRLARFHAANGATSLVGNVVVTSLGVSVLGFTPAMANALAVGLLAVLNYTAADRWVFARRAGVAATMVALAPTYLAAADLQRETVIAWDRHVAGIEASRPPQPLQEVIEPVGRTLSIAGGAIHEWRGSALVRRCTVSRLVNALMNPGTPPPQPDVLESRVLERDGNALRVYLKVVRHAIVTVTYDMEHSVRFDRASPGLATSQSIATRIVEASGDDHGFLWRLNSYWRYTQVGESVQIDMLSLSLSRSVPPILVRIAMPIINRVARESMLQALEAVKRFGESLPAERALGAGETVGLTRTSAR